MIENCRFLGQNEQVENRIKYICSFNNAKYEYKQGKVLKIDGVNVSIIEPHKFIIKVKEQKIILLYFNSEDNMFLYNRHFPIDFKQLKLVLDEMKGAKGNG